MTAEASGNSRLFAPIEPYVAELAASRALPTEAVALCTMRYADAGPALRASLMRAADARIEKAEESRLFFRALHIVGARRDPLGFDPLLRFLRRSSPDEVEDELGDAVTENLARIVAGVFDGNTDALFEAIADLRLDEFVRDALLGAATFLTWEGRVDRQRMISFLERFYAERLAPEEDFAWFSWVRAIGLLGLDELEPAALAAWREELIAHNLIDRDKLAADLRAARERPDDIGRFQETNLGYIEDGLEALQSLVPDEEDDEDGLSLPAEPWMGSEPSLHNVPAVNPWRHVGRNDPCPCGSGKKAKRCCLAA